MNEDPKNLLPDELVWSGEHLSEIALTALGDGQDEIIPKNAKDHAASCDACGAAMGHAAIASMQVGHAMRTPLAEIAAERAPVPWLAMIGALVLAIVGSAPSLLEAPHALVHQAPVALHAANALLRGLAGGLGPVVNLACAAFLILAGAMVARSMPRPRGRERFPCRTDR